MPAERVTEPIEAIDSLRKDLKKCCAISIVDEDVLSSITSGGDVIDGTWILDSQWSSHGASLATRLYH
jgi:hypothetical protein